MTVDEQLADQLAGLSIKPTVGAASSLNGDKPSVPMSSEPVQGAGFDAHDIDGLLRLISGINASIYEVEELRHAGSVQSAAVDTRMADLDERVKDLRPRIQQCTSDPSCSAETEDVEELQDQWERTSRQYVMLKEELRDDGWLVRFRSTAEQAESMMAPMQRSLDDCLAFLNTILPVDITPHEGSESETKERLEALSSSHEAMKRTYVPSVTKILKMMNKNMQEKSTRNGEALRRLGELEARWSTLSRQLQQLDGKLRIAVSRQTDRELAKSQSSEVLIETASVLSSPTPDYFGLPPPASASSHRSSISSSHSSAQQQVKANLGLGRAKSPARPEAERTVRRQSSNISNATAVNDRPPWKIGSRPPPVPSVPSMYAPTQTQAQTPQQRRLSSYGARPQDIRSPSPGGSSHTSISRASASGSRLPIRSPTAKTHADPSRFAAHPPYPAPLDRQMTSPASFQTPTRPRQSVPNSLPRSTTPLLGARSVSHGMVPRTEPVRRTLGRNPPTSFRAQTPTPSRPSSRMSAHSIAPATAALRPFEPSKYDMLDQEVARIIREVGFNLLTARLDAPLKKGQRKREDEEWKGEFVFGAGERSSSVKLLKLVGRGTDGAQNRIKCMCRVAGAWHDLHAVLNDRMARASAAASPHLSP